MAQKRAVVAIGGNALIKDQLRISPADQYDALREITEHIAQMILAGWQVVLAHGNGPQVGFALRRSELAAGELPQEPLDVCGADTQGWIGYYLQQNLRNSLRRLGSSLDPVTLITQVEVNPEDPAFRSPSKPIGGFMSRDEALYRQSCGWAVMEDAGRGWRRVVPSPLPLRIVEQTAISALIESGAVVIAAGGGGIPVVSNGQGSLHGVDAVIDKDLSAALLANAIGAETLILSTSVERVALNFGQPNQVWLDQLTLDQARGYLADGSHFARGSMGPKIQAAVSYLECGGTRAIITATTGIWRALNGQTGTHIVRESVPSA
jgi:carbamate kinase